MNNYELKFTTKFKKDFKKFKNKPEQLFEIKSIFKTLINSGIEGIPEKMKPPQLSGNYKNHWEFHIKPDLLLILFQYDEPTKTIYLTRVGSHSDLFG